MNGLGPGIAPSTGTSAQILPVVPTLPARSPVSLEQPTSRDRVMPPVEAASESARQEQRRLLEPAPRPQPPSPGASSPMQAERPQGRREGREEAPAPGRGERQARVYAENQALSGRSTLFRTA